MRGKIPDEVGGRHHNKKRLIDLEWDGRGEWLSERGTDGKKRLVTAQMASVALVKQNSVSRENALNMNAKARRTRMKSYGVHASGKN